MTVSLKVANGLFTAFAAVVAVLVVVQAVEGFGSTAPKTAPKTAPAPGPVSTTPAGGGSPAGTATAGAVTIAGFAFSDAPSGLRVGAKVTWTNTDGSRHTVTADDGSFDSPKLAKGETFEATFPKAGTFTYHCAIHETMTGTITVVD